MAAKKIQNSCSNLEVNVSGYRRAYVKCWQCSKSIALSSRTNKNGSWYWIISNYTQHILDHAQSRPNISIASYFKFNPGRSSEPDHDDHDKSRDATDANKDMVFHREPADNSSEYEEEFLEQTLDSEMDLEESVLVDPVKTESPVE